MPIGFDDKRREVAMELAKIVEPAHIQLRSALAGFLTRSLSTVALVVALKITANKYEEATAFLQKKYHDPNTKLD
jgi:hypothetical protein